MEQEQIRKLAEDALDLTRPSKTPPLQSRNQYRKLRVLLLRRAQRVMIQLVPCRNLSWCVVLDLLDADARTNVQIPLAHRRDFRFSIVH